MTTTNDQKRAALRADIERQIAEAIVRGDDGEAFNLSVELGYLDVADDIAERESKTAKHDAGQ